jgi:hypothetical protein
MKLKLNFTIFSKKNIHQYNNFIVYLMQYINRIKFITLALNIFDVAGTELITNEVYSVVTWNKGLCL